MSVSKDDQWFTTPADPDGHVYGADGDAVCQCFVGWVDADIVTEQQRAERIAKLPELEQRAEQAENALIDIRQWLEDGEQHQASPKATRDAIAAVVKVYFNPT